MFRRILCMAAVVLLLCGCSAVKAPEDRAGIIQKQYAAADRITLVADITANLNEEAMTYQIEYAYQKDNENAAAEMTILAPESIAGIKARISGEDFLFSYEDTELETAMPDRKGLTPADVTTYLLDDLMHGTPVQVWMENDRLALRYENKEETGTVVKDVYLLPESGSLANAHIYHDGQQIMECSFSSCTLQP